MPRNLSISDYTYDLPIEKIAFHPLEQRDQSKLLIYAGRSIHEDVYSNIDKYLDPNSLLVFNNTKVVEARLLFTKDTGAIIEIFCLEPSKEYADITAAMQQKASVRWNCLIGGASKWKKGSTLQKKISLQGQEIILQAKYLEKHSDYFSIKLSWQPHDLSFAEILHTAGVMPLPPYIKRTATVEDRERYQTVYAKNDGSVAAPTAGLHFTQSVFQKLKQKNIHSEFVTLHVGAGTFKPVKAATMDEHEMHSEFIDVSAESIQTIIDHAGKSITCVGTTSLRTIESLYWLGVKVSENPQLSSSQLIVQQWDPYELNATIEAKQALNALLYWMNRQSVKRIITTTQLLIAPSYNFKIVDSLVTNFHQPQSTLLLLVAAFVGEDWRKIYEFALQNNYRFLSYGDGCLLRRH